jgi:hypothetical protein
LKASAKDFDRASQRGGVGTVASQDGDVERGAVDVGGDGKTRHSIQKQERQPHGELERILTPES